MHQWVTIIFSDESQFNLTSDSLRTFKWSEPGTCYLPSNVLEIKHYGKRRLMVWAGITFCGRKNLQNFEKDTGIAVRYRDEVLELFTCLSRGTISSDFILMDDNVRRHKSEEESEYISRMDQPARSPDSNLREHA
ncbi:transposable element Tc1 transposase [Trichonephila clavipes]|nr:transposable element Tc1 transposase [Trichonephila clavipes]